MGFLFTHRNGDIGAITVTEPSRAERILKMDRHVLIGFCATFWRSVNRSSYYSFSCRQM